jgi:hypothetical protein
MRLTRTMLAVAALTLCGCGGSATSSSTIAPAPQVTIVSGNWGMSLIPQGNAGLPMAAGGVITQSGNTFSGIIHVQGSTCFDSKLDDLVITGTLAGSTISLTSAPVRGQALVLSVTPAANQVADVKALSGSWTLTGGTCAGSGTGLLVSVPPLSGTWSGTVSNATGGTISATLTQTGPDPHGFLQVAGSFSFGGVPCFTAGTVASGTISGLEANLVLNTNDGAQAVVSIIHNPTPPAESLITGVVPLNTTCFGNFIQATLNKQ